MSKEGQKFIYDITGDVKAPDVAIGPLVRKFFHELNFSQVDWAVLRGSEGLPDHTRYDIDLLIRDEDIDRAERALIKAAKHEAWSVVRIVDKFAYRCCMLISPGPEHRYLPIDFFGGCHHRFYAIADGAYGLRARKRNAAGVNVVPEGFGAALALLKELTRHPSFKENSREEVARGAREDAESFRRAVLQVLGEELTENLLNACQNDNWDVVEALVPEIRNAVRNGQTFWSPDASEFFFSNISQHLRPPMSGLVVLLGPDGSGKSTIADRVAQELYKQPYKICRRYEYNFRILPELKQFKKWVAGLLGRKLQEQEVIEPGTEGSGMNADHHALKGMGYVTYYALGYILGRLPLFKLRGRGALLVFARYFHDYYYQRGYGKVPRWYLRVLEALVPKPDLILYLDRDAEEIYRGKPELDVDEIRRQQTIIREMVEARPHGVVIDASKGIDATVAEVKKQIVAMQHGRWGIDPPGVEVTGS
ncbi:MAG: hypothetical protein ACPH9O_08665 [Akkermansiaceae bacterium]